MSSTPQNQSEYQGSNAEAYDDKRTVDAKWDREQSTLASLLARAAPTPAKVLDVPVGTGRFLATYAEQGHEVVGVDISDDMLRQAQAKLDELPSAKVTLQVGDITKLDVPDDAYDVSVCIRLMNLVPIAFVEQSLAELGRVTRTHLIVGLRTYDTLGTGYQVFDRARHTLRGKARKVTPHPQAEIARMFVRLGLVVEDKVRINEGKYHSSVYDYYLLRAPGSARPNA